MNDEQKQLFIATRVRALATVLLTRRDDLTLAAAEGDTGLDLLVHINREDKPIRLTLGVLLRGVWLSVTADQANKALAPTMRHFRGMRKLTYPACVFFFAMQGDQAFFSWLAEPAVAERAPKLVRHEKADCIELTDELVDQVVERVVAWYDAVEAAVGTEARP